MRIAFLRVRSSVQWVDENGFTYNDMIGCPGGQRDSGILNPQTPKALLRQSYELSELPDDVDAYIVSRMKECVNENHGYSDLDHESCIQKKIDTLKQMKADEDWLTGITSVNQLTQMSEHRRKHRLLNLLIPSRIVLQWLFQYGWRLVRSANFSHNVMEYILVID